MSLVKCQKCGALISDKAEFCPKCGVNIADSNSNDNNNISCKNCGKINSVKEVYCSNCGQKLKNNNSKLSLIIISVFLLIAALLATIFIYKKSIVSPIQGVSKKVYEQGILYLNEMDTTSVKEAVYDFLEEHYDIPLNEIAYKMTTVNFSVDIGNRATDEEIYYAKLIEKFWKSKAICYAHEVLVDGFEKNDNESIQEILVIYKEMLSIFYDQIEHAEMVLNGATEIKDLEEAYQILESIWED